MFREVRGHDRFWGSQAEIVLLRNVEGSGVSWIAPLGYRNTYIEGEHLCVGYVVSLGISRNRKPEFNPFSFSLSVLFYVVRLTRPLSADWYYNTGTRAECARHLKFGRDVTSGLIVLYCSAEVLDCTFRFLGWWLLIIFFYFCALLSVLAWPDHCWLVLVCFLVPDPQLSSGEKLKISWVFVQLGTSLALCVCACMLL